MLLPPTSYLPKKCPCADFPSASYIKGSSRLIPGAFLTLSMKLSQTLKSASVSDPVHKARGKKRNVRAGGSYERECRDDFRKIGYSHLVTTRSESKSRDGQKIDLMNKDEHLNGRFPYNVQCKNSCGIINYDQIYRGYTKHTRIKRTGMIQEVTVPPMGRCTGVINVILHKKTKLTIRTTKNGSTEEVFERQEEYAILLKSDFMKIVARLRELENKSQT